MSGPDLELGGEGWHLQRPGHRERLSVAQRIGWSVLALIVVGALAGLFGPGLLTTVTQTAPSGLVQFEYPRFTRYIADTYLHLRVRPDPAQPGKAQVWISSEYLSGVQVQQVQPTPSSWTGVDGGVVLAFPVKGLEPITVQMLVRPDEVGLLPGALGAPGREPIEFWQFVYP